MKKLIFVRDRIDWYSIFNKDGEVKPELGIGHYLLDVDDCIWFNGHYGAQKLIGKQLNEWYSTSYPYVLNWPYWFNKETKRYEIYFVEDGKLVNIHDAIYENLREENDVEKIYLLHCRGGI